MPRTLPAAASFTAPSLATGLLTTSPAQTATGTIRALGRSLDVTGESTADGAHQK